jgi:hypothetical protein
MISVDSISVMNIENAICGMRNPMGSWAKSDSYDDFIGPCDLQLAKSLVLAGTDHSKFMRQIFVSMDITAPRYWWAEMDQYKVSTATNSESTMHCLHKTPITVNLFSYEYIAKDSMELFEEYCEHLEILRQTFNETKDRDVWKTLIQMLPASFNQMRTWTGNYQVLRNVYHARKNHKLQEWYDFCKVIDKLQYSELITCEKVNES